MPGVHFEIPIFAVNTSIMSEKRFYKFHGTGNDFILIDDRNRSFPVSEGLIKGMCDRHLGIGADGLILLREKKGHDFAMVYFNADGRESTMCGNGGRCVIAFADFLSLVVTEANFLAVDGTHQGNILHRTEKTWQIKLKLADVKGSERWNGGYLMDTGSPHLVLFQDNLAGYDVFREGKRIRNTPPFQEAGINVDYAEWLNNELYVRTYERGVENETLSCGTGVTAAALAHALEQGPDSGKARIRTNGGRLTVSFKREGEDFVDVWLEGPAVLVYHGNYLIDEN